MQQVHRCPRFWSFISNVTSITFLQNYGSATKRLQTWANCSFIFLEISLVFWDGIQMPWSFLNPLTNFLLIPTDLMISWQFYVFPVFKKKKKGNYIFFFLDHAYVRHGSCLHFSIIFLFCQLNHHFSYLKDFTMLSVNLLCLIYFNVVFFTLLFVHYLVFQNFLSKRLLMFILQSSLSSLLWKLSCLFSVLLLLGSVYNEGIMKA